MFPFSCLPRDSAPQRSVCHDVVSRSVSLVHSDGGQGLGEGAETLRGKPEVRRSTQAFREDLHNPEKWPNCPFPNLHSPPGCSLSDVFGDSSHVLLLRDQRRGCKFWFLSERWGLPWEQQTPWPTKTQHAGRLIVFILKILGKFYMISLTTKKLKIHNHTYVFEREIQCVCIYIYSLVLILFQLYVFYIYI